MLKPLLDVSHQGAPEGSQKKKLIPNAKSAYILFCAAFSLQPVCLLGS